MIDTPGPIDCYCMHNVHIISTKTEKQHRKDFSISHSNGESRQLQIIFETLFRFLSFELWTKKAACPNVQFEVDDWFSCGAGFYWNKCSRKWNIFCLPISIITLMQFNFQSKWDLNISSNDMMNIFRAGVYHHGHWQNQFTTRTSFHKLIIKKPGYTLKRKFVRRFQVISPQCW